MSEYYPVGLLDRRLVAGVLGASLALSGCTVSESPAPAVTQTNEMSPAPQPCLDMPINDPTELGIDKLPLALPAPSYDRFNRRWVGSITLRPDKRGAIVDRGRLPEAYDKAFDDALSEPYIGCSLDDVKGVRLGTTPGPELASFQTRYHDDEGQVWLVYTASPSEADLIRSTEGTAIVLTHEVTHGRFENWAQASDPKVKAELTALRALFVADALPIFDKFYEQHEKAIDKVFNDLITEFKQKGQYDEWVASELALSAMKDPKQRESLLFDLEDPEAAVRTFAEMISGTGDALGSDIFDKLYEADLTALNKLSEEYFAFREGYYPTSDESHCLEGYVGSDAGGPGTSLNEWVASTVTCDVKNPKGVIEALQSLPPERRALAVEGRRHLVKLFKLTEPEVLPFISTQKVLASQVKS